MRKCSAQQDICHSYAKVEHEKAVTSRLMLLSLLALVHMSCSSAAQTLLVLRAARCGKARYMQTGEWTGLQWELEGQFREASTKTLKAQAQAILVSMC